MEVAADTELLQLNLIGPKQLTRSADRVVRWMVEVGHVVRIESDFRRKEFRVPINLFRARVPVQPRPVRIRKWLDISRFPRCRSRICCGSDPDHGSRGAAPGTTVSALFPPLVDSGEEGIAPTAVLALGALPIGQLLPAWAAQQ